MEVILTKDVQNLGYQNDVVKVKNGYGRNYLIPQGFAILGTESNKKSLTETLKQKSFKEQKLRDAAEKTAKDLSGVAIKVGAKAGESGKIFGSVNVIQIADAIKKLGFEVDRKNITIAEDHIKALGKYSAKIKLYKDIHVDIEFDVIEE